MNRHRSLTVFDYKGCFLFTFSAAWCVSGIQEGAQPLSIFLQMCDGSRVGRAAGWPHAEGTNCAPGLLGPLLQQSGVYHHTHI